MSDFGQTAVNWWLHMATAGAGVLLLGWAALLIVRDPARRVRLTGWAVRGAVLTALLGLTPAWLTITLPRSKNVVTSATVVKETAPESVPFTFNPQEAEIVEEWPVAVMPTESVTVLEPTVTPNLAPAPVPEPVPTTPERVASFPVFLLIYAVIAVGFLGQLLLAHAAIWRLRHRSVTPPERVLRAIRGLPGVGRITVLVSDRIDTPFCFGMFRPTVLLPRHLAITANSCELRWIVAHELDHLNRGDPRTAIWVGLGRAMFFFVPWFWTIRRELSLAQEYLADAAAAAADGRPVDYAAFLVNLSSGAGDRDSLDQPVSARGVRTRNAALSAAHAVRAGKSDLFRRVNMLVNSGSELDRRCPRGWTALAAGGFLSAAVVLSGLGLAVADDERPKPEGQRIEKKDAPREGERPAVRGPRDGEGVRPGPRDGDGPAPRGPREGDRPLPPRADGERGLPPGPPPANPDEILRLKRQIEAAVRNGNADEVRELIQKLERALVAGKPGRAPLPPDGLAPRRGEEGDRPRPEGERRPDGDRPRPEGERRPDGERPRPEGGEQFGGRGFGGVGGPGREMMAETIRALEAELAKTKDPAAKEGMARAIEGLKKGMEAQRQAMGFGGMGFGPGAFPGGAPGQPGFVMGGGNLMARMPFGRLGVAVARPSETLIEQLDLPAGNGLVVQDVIKGSTAEKAGIKKNDVLLSLNGKGVPANEQQLAEVIAGMKPGEKVEIVVLRKGKKETVTAELPVPPRVEGLPGRVEIELRPDTPKIGFESMSASVQNDKFEVKATKGNTKYDVQGVLEGGRSVAEKIVVVTGEKKASYDSLDAVPEAHRPAVRQLLNSVGGR